MPRYKLKKPHYLDVPGTEWEQNEIGPNNRQIRHRYKVHTYLDPEDPTCQNYPGVVIVASEANPLYPFDYVFVGSPTSEMDPLDAEGKALIDKLPGVAPMSEVALPTFASAPITPPPSTDLQELRQMLAEMRGQVTTLIGQNEALQRRVEAAEEAQVEAPTAGAIPPRMETPAGAQTFALKA